MLIFGEQDQYSVVAFLHNGSFSYFTCCKHSSYVIVFQLSL